MNAADESLGNVLLVGLGAVAIQVALDLRRHGAGDGAEDEADDDHRIAE
ncbi:hypothetical protein HKT44_20830, partial [Pseudomonas aeruginosa]|nr:hypothetical protein [Pseudomonas aeruginosa]